MTIGIIGRVADGADLGDGQTIKTRVLREELKRKFPDAKIICADTYNYKKRAVKLVFQTISILKKCDCVFVLLSRGGSSVFFPMIYHLNKIFKKPIYHDVIGGALCEWVTSNKKWHKYINSFTVNWVELDSLRDNLKKINVNNAESLPNFKRLPILSVEELDLTVPSVFRFCTFSRVTESKGILTAADAIKYLNERAGRKIATLDVYGEVESEFTEAFNKCLSDNPDVVFYKGKVSYDKSVETIKDYYMLLFPTTHSGEGFPGTLIDAFSAGLPIIATDWKYNAELIKDGVTGYCYPPKDINLFKELLWRSIQDPSIVFEMKGNCLKEAGKYTPESIMGIICDQMKKDKII